MERDLLQATSNILFLCHPERLVARMLRLPELPARERSAELTSKPPPPAVAAADAVSRKLATDRREGGQTSFKPPTTGVPLYPFWCDALFGAEALKKGRARDDIKKTCHPELKEFLSTMCKTYLFSITFFRQGI